ncbi:DUF4262 domain-containing protein [Phenylobacterium sp.]|uniref:DUF4262 domain-containing protein n=1 Tax=Phenylobacterium sp. TaxID=1871053 RepID=UPI003D2D43D6
MLETALDDPVAILNDYEKNLVAMIREHGWQTTSVGEYDDDPAFSYTTGFWWSSQGAEVLVFDFPPDLAHNVFGQMMAELRSGRTFPVMEPVPRILAGEDVYLFPVRPEAVATHLLSSRWFYKQHDFPVVQLVWSDQGRFPWETGFDATLLNRQPDLSPRGWAAELRG